MRYYHGIENRILPNLRLMLQDPFMQFGKDIIYLFSVQHGTGWKPYVFYDMYNVIWKAATRSYTPHLLSPCTNDIRRAMKLTIVNMEEKYFRIYRSIVSVSGEEKLLGFVNHIYTIIQKHFSQESSAFKLFFTVQYIARLSVFFHERGTPDAPHIAVVLIGLFLYKEQNSLSSRSVFGILNAYSKQLIHGYEQLKKMRQTGRDFSSNIN